VEIPARRDLQEKTMKAAVLHSFDHPPRFEEMPEPIPLDNEVLVHITAAALNPSTRLLASGRHYASLPQLPAVAGVEGVGRLEDGSRVFFGVRRVPNGSMCQRTVVPRLFCWPIPEGVDDLVAAALPNPALSSWLPLVTTAQLVPGEGVLVLGATGVAGQLAIQIAKHLGAGRVVAVGRNESVLCKLQELGADAVISLRQPDQELIDAFKHHAGEAGFDVVLDYLWGHPTEVLIAAMNRKGFPSPRSGARLVQIGEGAGSAITLEAMALRGASLTIIGSGTLPSLSVLSEAFNRVLILAATGKLHVEVEAVPLAEIEKAWARSDLHGRRLVIVP
jgi:NADPH:quinone reductase-like Zn-dependent oxidoreductase